MTFLKRLIAVKKALLTTAGLFLFLAAKAQFPVADFTASTTSGCSPLTVDFTNLSTQANQYYWDFGNGNTSSLANPTTVYSIPGTYTVRLVAINSMTGNRDTLIKTDYIFIPDNPVTDFVATTLTGCANNNAISFTNLSTGATSYVWDFGDGTYSTATNPVHTYLSPGTYTVKLIATNSYGCSKIKTQNAYITIHPYSVASFSVNQQSSCDQNTIFNFTSTSQGAVSWLWDFGDGNTSVQQNPTHIYGSTGNFSVTLIVTNSFGCTDTNTQQAFINIGPTLIPTFTVTSQTGCVPFNTGFQSTVPNATSWLWNFGDGNTSTLENPSHTYATPGSYNITLTVTTTSGCNGTVTHTNFITVDPLPVAHFTVQNPTGCKPFATSFINNSTGAVSYLWDFGNGQTSTDTNPSFTYINSGTYDVTLTAYSASGCVSVYTLSGAIVVNSITGGLSANPRIGCAPLPVSFNASASPAAVSWFWSFGDGNTSTLQSPTNIYTAIGNYNVMLIVTSANGCTDTLRRPAYIKVVTDTTPYTVPDTIKVCLPPGTVSFTDPTIGSNSWHWDFGDGDTSDVKNPSHAYTSPGIYTVTLTTGMAGGCTQYFNPYAIIEVVPFVTSPIQSLIVSPCSPYTVAFSNPTPNVAGYFWDFGDGTTSTDPNPTHVYAQPGNYTISVLLTATNGCQTNLTVNVSFGYSNPVTISDNDICLGDTITFGLNPASAFASALWDFGDGNTSSLLQPSHLYTSVGTYLVSVIVTDSSGCVDTFSTTSPVIVSDPVPGFVVNQDTVGCINFPVTFTNTSTGANSYQWNFGTGNTSTQVNPTYTYQVPGVYTVTLVATSNGCSRTYAVPNQITANQAVADFSFTPNTGCLPLTVTFTDLSVNPVSWSWDFGDGGTSTVQNPVYVYNSVPTGNIKLTITDVNGCTRTRSKANVNPVIPVINVNDSIGCRPLRVNFSTPTNAASYLWDFGDGNTSIQQNPSHLYTQAGTYTVTLTIVLASGCTTSTTKQDFIRVNAPVSDFMTPTVSVCAPSLVNFVNLSSGATSWLWLFGDGTSSTLESPSHIYHVPGTYTVTLVSYSQAGCADTLIKVDYIIVPGTFTLFGLASGTNCANTMVQFTDSSINATSWFWDFGDGVTSTQQHPGHIYTNAGNYTVTLITSDGTGCSSYYTYPNPIVVHPLPDAVATVDSSSGCQPLTVNFSNNSVGATNYLWNFGNGDTSSVASPVYTYAAPGIYSPQLVVYSSVGCSDTLVFPGEVDVWPVPQASFVTSAHSGCSPATITFTNSSSNLSSPSYWWDNGAGIFSSSQNPVITFTDSGSYTVTLVVTNAEGCSDTTSAQVVINQSPQALGAIANFVGCEPLVVNLTSSSLYASQVIWHFGNGDTSSQTNISYTYTAAGIYHPYLVAYSLSGCTDTMYFSNPVTVNSNPQADFSVVQNVACPGETFQFINNSSPVTGLTFDWTIGGITDTTFEPSIILNNPGYYDVNLVATNQYGCTDTNFQTAFIQVYDTIPPPVSPILSVSVLNNTQVEIIWENSVVNDLGAYILYRKNLVTGVFDEIYRDNTPSSAAQSPTSSYTDNGLNTLTQVYTYILQTEDQCAYSLPISVLTPHTTINITAVAVGLNINVSWTPYGGCTVGTYELNRVNQVTGVASHIASLPAGVFSFVDQGFSCPHPFSYRITATALCGTTYLSLSDTSVAVPYNILADQKVEVVRSTVIDDKDVLTEWLPPVLAPERVKEYQILRSTDNIGFVPVAVVPKGIFSYIDDKADVHGREYYYRVDVISDCDVVGSPSNNSSSIYLQADYKNEKTRLWWTPYSRWDTGVDYYEVEKLNWAGQWERVRRVPGTEITTTLDE
jgi:PKD repeat protein